MYKLNYLTIFMMKRTIENPVIKDTITFLQTSKESGGKITDLVLTLMPKGGNILHYHPYAEKFTAILIGGKPCFCQARFCVQAVRKTHSPNRTIKPCSSAAGIN